MTHYGGLLQLPGRTAQPGSYRRANSVREAPSTSNTGAHPHHRYYPAGYQPPPIAIAPSHGVDSDLDSSSEEDSETEVDTTSDSYSDSDSDDYSDSDSSSEDERENARQQYLQAKAIREQELAAAAAAATTAAISQRGGAGRPIYDGPGDRRSRSHPRYSDSRRQSKSRDRERPRREDRDRRRKHSGGGAAAAATRSADRSADKARRNRGDRDLRRERSGDKKRRRKKRGMAAAAVDNEKYRGGTRKKRRGGGGGGPNDPGRDRRPWWKRYRALLILIALTLLIIIIAVPVGVSVNKKKKDGDSADGLGVGKSGEHPGSVLKDSDRAKIPAEDRNTYYDPWSWVSTKDLNVTYTKETVGGLPIMGLFDEWDDSARANPNVPPLKDPFPYGKLPIRGVNVGGWLLIEPFITPSFFKEFSLTSGVVDEYTLSKKYGRNRLPRDLEEHYDTFFTEQTFKEIRDAGLDHVRIPFGYWAVKQLDGDPYLFRTSWRYLLRGIEWARKYGLRVNVDLHSVPGNANGWNHSGRLGQLEWLKGDKGEEYGKMTLEIHQQLAKFFSQPRYKNVVTIYGLVNEPRMIDLDANRVIKWTEQAEDVVRSQGYEGLVVFGDGFRGLPTWKGTFAGRNKMVLDVHQYTIFNDYHISLTHSEKIDFVCKTWSADMIASGDTSTGYGPTFVGEWSQADTDCTEFLNDVGQGTRWDGSFLAPVTRQPDGPARCNKKEGGSSCSCAKANEDPSKYTDVYKQFLLMFAETQMEAFEKGWGWMYWTWDTETAHQWSYKKGLAAGIIPKDPAKRKNKCSDPVPDFGKLGLPETY